MRKCKECNEPFTPKYNTIQPTCSIPCAIAYGNRKREQEADKAFKKKKREYYENDSTTQEKAAVRAFNAFIRYRDRDNPCISCDKPANWTGLWAAGHYHTVGARSDLRFNEDNCHKQCNRDCNQGRSGNITNYTPRLIAKIGADRVEALAKVSIVRYRAEDYRGIAKHYRHKLRELKETKQ